MDHNTTIPSVLGPDTGAERTVTRQAGEPESNPVFKLVFWAAVTVLLISAFRYFTH